MSRAGIEIVTTDGGTHVRTVAGNSQVGFTSEVYTGPSARRSARRAVRTLARLMYPGMYITWVNSELLTVLFQVEEIIINLPVRYVDERSQS